jgi:hypothetical protein
MYQVSRCYYIYKNVKEIINPISSDVVFSKSVFSVGNMVFKYNSVISHMCMDTRIIVRISTDAEMESTLVMVFDNKNHLEKVDKELKKRVARPWYIKLCQSINVDDTFGYRHWYGKPGHGAS